MALTTPDWLMDVIHEYAYLLKLTHWTFGVDLALCVDGDEHTRAACLAQPNVNYASLTFRADVENTAEWHRTIIHELIHVMHGPVDQVIECVIVPELADATRGMALTAYMNAYERFVDLLSKTLCELVYDDGSDTESDELVSGDVEELGDAE